MGTNDSLQKIVETLDEPLQEILCSLRNSLHVAGSKLSKNDEPQRNNPAHHHGIGEREAKEIPDLDRFLRKAMLLLLFINGWRLFRFSTLRRRRRNHLRCGVHNDRRTRS